MRKQRSADSALLLRARSAEPLPRVSSAVSASTENAFENLRKREAIFRDSCETLMLEEALDRRKAPFLASGGFALSGPAGSRPGPRRVLFYFEVCGRPSLPVKLPRFPSLLLSGLLVVRERSSTFSLFFPCFCLQSVSVPLPDHLPDCFLILVFKSLIVPESRLFLRVPILIHTCNLP